MIGVVTWIAVIIIYCIAKGGGRGGEIMCLAAAIGTHLSDDAVSRGSYGCGCNRLKLFQKNTYIHQVQLTVDLSKDKCYTHCRPGVSTLQYTQ